MAISTEVRLAGPYKGNGTTRVFPFEFVALNKTDVQVIVGSDDLNSESILSQGYNVRLNADQDNNPGGEVELDTALDEGKLLAITTDMPYLQQLVLTNRGGFYPESVNDAFDKVVIMIQQLLVRVRRALFVPLTSDQTPEEALANILDIASRANELNEEAKKIYDEIERYRDQIKEQAEYAAGADKYATEAEQARALAYAASADASTSADLSEEWAQKSKEFAEKSGFGFRYCEGATSGESIYVKNVVPSDLLKVGDHIVNRDGEVFLVVEVSEDKSTCTLSKKITSLQGPAGADGKDGERGPQGEPGPEGLQGPQGPMGESPWATAFGQFRLEDPYLKLDYVGADLGTVWNIREDGQLTVDIEEQ